MRRPKKTMWLAGCLSAASSRNQTDSYAVKLSCAHSLVQASKPCDAFFVASESDIERSARITAQFIDELPCWHSLETLVVPAIQAIALRGDAAARVDARIKEPASLQRKLLTRSQEVTTLHEITDLLGIRIVTLHLNAITPIVSGIKSSFHIDDRKSGLRTNSAGYRSTHLVCAPAGSDRWFEVQIRTASEHAWSELQHPIYKGTSIDGDDAETLVRIATLYHEADVLAANLRKRFDPQNHASV